MYTPWGQSDSDYTIERGVHWVGTPSHGGFMIANATAKRILSEPAQRLGEQCGDYIAFEEDCAASVVFHEHNEFMASMAFARSGGTPDSMREWVNRWYPHYFQSIGHVA